jgi:hypothetical protein
MRTATGVEDEIELDTLDELSEDIEGENEKDDIPNRGTCRRFERGIVRLFRHPVSRVVNAIALLVLNLIIYNEDPISYSTKETTVYALGRVFNFPFRQYPPPDEPLWICLKAFLAIAFLTIGAAIGKYALHDFLLRDCMRVGIFEGDMGSWTIMTASSCLFLFLGSLLYNVVVTNHFYDEKGGDNSVYLVTDYVGLDEKTFALIAVFVTSAVCSVLLFVVVDGMLQDAKRTPKRAAKYGCESQVAEKTRTCWNDRRLYVFFATLAVSVAFFFFFVGSQIRYGWITSKAGHFAWNETVRCWVASFVVFCDMAFFLQDWDYPRFKRGTKDGIKSPCCCCDKLVCFWKRAIPCKIKLHGKWINYVPWLIATVLNFNLLFNQALYVPTNYDQIYDENGYVMNVNFVSNSTVYDCGTMKPNEPFTVDCWIEDFDLLNAKGNGTSGFYENTDSESWYDTLRFGGSKYDDGWCLVCGYFVSESEFEMVTDVAEGNYTAVNDDYNATVRGPGVAYNASLPFAIKYENVRAGPKAASAIPTAVALALFFISIAVSACRRRCYGEDGRFLALDRLRYPPCACCDIYEYGDVEVG